MNALRGLLFSAVVLALAASAGARLGDTLAEAIQRYGDATERSALLPATLARGFTVADLAIEVDFVDEAVHRVTYSRKRPFTEEEIQKILADNAGTYPWRLESDRLDPVRAAAGSRAWRRSDRGSAILTRRMEGTAMSETLVLTDAVWLAANLKLRSAPKAAASSTPPPKTESAASHSLTWTGYDGTGDAAAAHLVLDGRDLGSSADGLSALKRRLAALPAKAVVKVVPYYGDPGGTTPKRPPLDLSELRTFCETHSLTLLVPQAQ